MKALPLEVRLLHNTPNNILAKLRVESHFESDPNIVGSGPNIVEIEG